MKVASSAALFLLFGFWTITGVSSAGSLKTNSFIIEDKSADALLLEKKGGLDVFSINSVELPLPAENVSGLEVQLNMNNPAIRMKPNGIITLATRGHATLFKNGREIIQVKDADKLKKIPLNLRTGDVLTVSSSIYGGKFGVLMGVKQKGSTQYTGTSRRYKAEVYKPSRKAFLRFWKTKKYSSCRWRRPRSLKARHQYSINRKAKYVWVSYKGKPWDYLYMRYVVGGEKCGAGHQYCPCRPVANKNGFCYDLKRKSARRGYCKRRKCATKYICVPGNRKLPLCVRRYSHYKVIPKSYQKGHRYCKKVKIDPPTPFWVPYY